MVALEKKETPIAYGLHSTNGLLDQAYMKFNRVKELTAELAEVENSVYRWRTLSKRHRSGQTP